MRKSIILSTILALSCLVAFAAKKKDYKLTPDQKLRMAEYVIENFYVEKVDTDSIVEEAIRAMLRTLDPHSAYSTPAETTELNQPLEGKFSGIGIQFNMVADTLYVIQPTAGGPCEKAGMLPGDRIVSANDTVIAGRKMPNSAIIKILRGPKGSKVALKVKRGSSPELIDFVVVRDDIPIYSVDDAYMVNDSVGYISVSRFADRTAEEVLDAARKLRKRGMHHLILDMSSNGGGYLGSAHDLAAAFLGKGDPVVYTQGLRSPRMQFDADADGELRDGRLVVIVNQYSASAAEILSGAIQDNDRGLIVGRRTFGKGLVQRPFPFPDGSMIRLTTSRYYTPSGRCIQKHYEKGRGEEYMLDLYNRYKSGELWHADSVHLDSTQVYQTLRRGRTVYGGGGIMPDVFVPVDTSHYSIYYRDLVAKGSINQFCLGYVDRNRREILKKYPTEDDFYANFKIDDTIEQALVARGEADGVPFNEAQWQVSRTYIDAIIKGILARDLYDNGSMARSTNPLNPDFREAVDLISDPVRYNRLLNNE